MKAEKRHELQQNELADWLGEQIEAAKPYGTTIAIVVLGGLLAIGLAIYLASAGNPASAGAWSQYFAAFNDREPAVALKQLAEEQPNTSAALWAQQSIGDINLSQGSIQLFSDREEAKKMLEKAEVAYKEVETKATDSMLKSRSRLGLAKLYEATNKPEEAKRYYEMVVAAEKDSAIGKAAAAGAKRVSDPREVALLAWFDAQKPRKPAPFPGAGGLPGLPNDLPERPDLSLPGLGGSVPGTGLNLEGLGTGKSETPGLEFPKPGETPAGTPATTTPPVTASPESTPPAEVKPE
jgi:tetratricopeptide (TPR) repeat protein